MFHGTGVAPYLRPKKPQKHHTFALPATRKIAKVILWLQSFIGTAFSKPPPSSAVPDTFPKV